MTIQPDPIADMVDDLTDTLSEPDAIEVVARTIDALLPLDAIPGPIGALLERHDGDLVGALVEWIRDVIADPERQARRQERRAWLRARACELRDAGESTARARRLARRDWRRR
jgi:hypothetical protein